MSETVRHRKISPGKKSDFQDVSARSRYELYQSGTDNDTVWRRLFSFSGMYETPTWSAIIWAFLFEMLGSWWIGTAVGVATWFSAGQPVLLSGLIIGAVYAVAYYAGTRLPVDFALRRHLSGAITVGYLVTQRIGVFGAAFYVLAQYCGGMIAGGTLRGALSASGYDFVGPAVTQAVVPLPNTITSGIHTVWCLELFGSLLYVLVLLCTEFVGTKEDTDRQPKNFKKATFNVALTIVVLCVVGGPFQVTTFNNVAYWGPLFSGVGQVQTGRTLSMLADLHDTVLFPNSVFGPTGDGLGYAWALYLFMPAAGGLLGGLLFLGLFMERYSESAMLHKPIPEDAVYDNDKRKAIPSATLRNADIQSQLLPTPFLQTH